MRCTYTIRQLTYIGVRDAIEKYLQIYEKTSRDSLNAFCKGIMKIWRAVFANAISKKLYAFHEEKPGGDHLSDSFILLEETASRDLWIYHALFGVSEKNNGVNITRQSPIFNDLKDGKTTEVPFVANDVTYKWGY
ncbi:putative nuclease HARBI1 [Tanacetum coccineum]